MSNPPTWAGVAPNPGGFADLAKALRDDFGIDFAGPFDGEFTGAYWQEYSAETRSPRSCGDVVLMDAKNGQTPLADKVAACPGSGSALPGVAGGARSSTSSYPARSATPA